MSEVVTPVVGDLSIECAVQCPFPGCGEVLQSSSQLHMHTVRRHDRGSLDPATGSSVKLFYCPFEGCKRSEGGGRPFPRLGQLKQHYQTVHSEKVFTCRRCGREFGLRDVCLRHENQCGEDFTCATCGVVFHTKNALYKHAKRKQHSLPEARKKQRQPQKTPPSVPPVFVLPPPLIKQVVRLAKQVSIATQTTKTATERAATVDTMCQTLPRMLYTQEHPHRCQDVATFACGLSDPYPPSEATGSSSSSGSFHPCLSATQTDLSLTDLSTQTDLTYLATKLLNFGTQTVGAMATQACQTHVAQETQLSALQSSPNIVVSVGCEYGSRSVAGTQTAVYDTQTGEFASEMSRALECRSCLEFGTQTAPFPPESSDYSFVEQALSSTVLPPDCMDFGTQTLDSLPSLHFGVQTLLLSETKDQGSQT